MKLPSAPDPVLRSLPSRVTTHPETGEPPRPVTLPLNAISTVWALRTAAGKNTNIVETIRVMNMDFKP
jgi:hypothetical protein